MWVVVGLLLFAAAAVGMLPLGWVALVLQVLGFCFVAMVVVWPEIWAHELRKDDAAGLRGRDRPTVVTYLPVVVALFSLPFYLLAQATLFWRVGTLAPGLLPVGGWPDAWRLSLDNLLFTELFLDLFDVFGIGLAEAPAGLGGRLIVFLTRLLLSVGFVRIALSLSRAAYYRALGLGRGSDTLVELDDAVLHGDAVRAGYLGRELTEEVRGTVDVLLARLRESGLDQRERNGTYRSLRALRDWATPTLRRRVHRGDPRAAEYELLLTDLQGPWAAYGPELPRRRPGRIVVAVASTATALALIALGPPAIGLAAGTAAMIALVWLLASPRAAYETAMEWGIVPYVKLPSLRRAVVLSSCLLATTFLFVSWTTLWHAASLWPSSFAGIDVDAGRWSLLGFVGASLVRVQATLSIPDVFRVAESAVEQRPFVGSLLTLLLRTGLNLGFVAVVLTSLSLRRDREGLAGLLRAPDALAMRIEALRGGRYAFHLVTYHDTAVGARLWSALDAADDADTQDALAASGAFEWCMPYASLREPSTPRRLRSQAVVIDVLARQGWDVGPWCSELDAALASGSWPPLIRAQVLARRAAVAARYGDVAGATTRFDEAAGLIAEASDPGAAGEALETRAVWARCALAAASSLPLEALTDGTVATLTERANAILAELVGSHPEQFTVDALRLGSLHAPLVARSVGLAAGVAELERVTAAALGLARRHPWRDAMLVQLLVSTGVVSALSADEADVRAAGEIEQRLLDELGESFGDWRPDCLPVRAYDECLGEELGQATLLLTSVPASHESYAAARRAAVVFEARSTAGVATARAYAEALYMLAAKTAHQLGEFRDVKAAADDVFRLAVRLHSDHHRDHLLASLHAYCAVADRALGDEAAAWEHAARARALYAEIAVSGWERSEEVVAEGRELLTGFGGDPSRAEPS